MVVIVVAIVVMMEDPHWIVSVRRRLHPSQDPDGRYGWYL